MCNLSALKKWISWQFLSHQICQFLKKWISWQFSCLWCSGGNKSYGAKWESRENLKTKMWFSPSFYMLWSWEHRKQSTLFSLLHRLFQFARDLLYIAEQVQIASMFSWFTSLSLFFFFFLCVLLGKYNYFVLNFFKSQVLCFGKISLLDLIFFSFTIGNFCC